jgi:ketosteroid isomerase-like protein
MPRLQWILVFVCSLMPAFAADMRQSVEVVLQAEREGCKAYATNDADGVRRFLTDDYTLTDAKGRVTSKQDDLDDFMKHRIHYTTFENKEMKVRLHAGMAIVTGRTVVKGVAGKDPFDVEVQFTDTLVYMDGRWRLAAGHVSRLRDSKLP